MMYRAIGACSAVLFSLTLSAPPVLADNKPMTLNTRLGQSVMRPGEKQRNYVRIGVTGCEREKTERNPVNVAFVIDRSGSMQGSRIAQAQEAAIAAIRRLDRDDIASVVIFDDRVDVLVPAQQVTDHALYADRIRRVLPRNQTAIYAGVNAGANEVRKFKDNRRLNRVVLLSDGLANVGPREPDEFAVLGRQLLAEGISVSTIGLGLDYNEDLMSKLARASDGNHAFVSNTADLVPIFNREFDDVLATCAQMVSLDVKLRPGARVVRALSRDATIEGQNARVQFSQIYQGTEHYVLLEIELDKDVAKGEQELGEVNITYTSQADGSQQTLTTAINARFSTVEAELTASRDSTVIEAVVEQTTRDRAATAVKLRDQGKLDEARALFQQNASEIGTYAATAPAPSPRMIELQKEYGAIATAPPASPSQWNQQRKQLRQLDTLPAGARARY